MTVCGNKMTGVCVMGKCPYIKACNGTVWDKSPSKEMIKIRCDECKYHGECVEYGHDPDNCRLFEPIILTNEEWIRQASTEELAELLIQIYRDGRNDRGENTNKWYERCEANCELWLKEKHDAY